ncbi:excinuclease ABC subunit UvrA [Pseudomonas sp. CCI3.2]|uniref:excinuclease ABC subunit UvrA n=1 Tax=unclassified Pseudomonas TaxID=196821 RepID=UPI002AC94004|nr:MULTISPECIES: excinuclease ABC subunit UvrA [unclassified Pseudomonas]MEB0077652.1 excinuclease ABC subunit UvrA [Pseudomonas sp. MH10out]MEB0093912.1 excinuclease ABC subunit UvrA [Pseudomonas sp. CCI4.2]MEB0101354.1 excinuclease ABC subunit UvrA [Pseudomonas sp. CCI3.2]MEB0131461.1 excinuclease ABC subunit UvrA [Pseudomonas sp. CCI2.4]MEB0158471.1 excinuclease ABC subunit UvrA [Pseudomonas sp. AH2 (2023)]
MTSQRNTPDDQALSAVSVNTSPLNSSGFVRVRGAREHNLKNVDVDIPRDALVVFTGVSGSGKSSLAFSTLYAEAQRRYFESVAPYARRLIDQVGVPDVDSIEGLPPAVALQQQRGTPSTRSSVGSVTTLSSLVRMLYSRAGSYPAGQPMLYAEDFSPNTPQGACPDCHGLGRVYEVTEQTMVPDDTLTIRQRAVASWPTAWQGQNQRDILVTLGYDVDIPWRDLPKKQRDWILFTEETPTAPVYAGLSPLETQQALKRKLEPSYQGTFTGARRYVLHTFAHSQSALMKKRVARFMIGSQCPLCSGKRLTVEALSVKFAGYDIGELSQMPLLQLAEVLRPVADNAFVEVPTDNRVLSKRQIEAARQQRLAKGGSAHGAAPDVRLTPNLSVEKRLAAQRIAHDLLARVSTLTDLGLGYLALERSTPTLSSGELQRLRLATQLGSQLFGVIYVLDEPSAGLHPADGEALFGALQRLKAAGNSLFVVEHDIETMRRADWLIDVGPAAGEHGGHVLYSGPPAGLAHIAASQTRPHLFAAQAPHRQIRRETKDWLRLEGVTRNNLNNVSAAFPLGCFTAVTGISGSGKSSLVSQALLELVGTHLGRTLADVEQEELSLEDDAPQVSSGQVTAGLASIRRLVKVDQKPIGRTPRSNLATYTGLFDSVRKLFAATPDAKHKHYDAGQFSFNVAKGRCPACEGEGFVSVELLFMPSVYAPCPTCHGARYNQDTLQISWQGLNIAQVLQLTVEEAVTVFAEQPSVLRSLTVLRDIGLGYLRLGQPATELSGGEAQRIKLATELQRVQRGSTLYVLDEPTTGLHPCDVDRLLTQLNSLVDAGHTVIVVEHEMRVVAQSDWVIDIGPGAGDEGGRLVACGTPEAVVGVKASRTAPFLANILSGSNTVLKN